MSKATEYNSMKISRERTGFGHIRNQSQTIKITPENVCIKGADACFWNATSTCHKCAILNADTNLEILFRPSPWKPPIPDAYIQKIPEKISLPAYDQEKLLKPPIPEPIKVATQLEEDESDKLTLVKFICESITHSHSKHYATHTHFPTYGKLMIGSACYVCNYNPVYGRHLCPSCEQILLEE